jgi:type VI secretion system protein VasD
MLPSVKLRSLGLVPLVALATGCSLLPGKGAKEPSPIRLSVTAGPRLNPDEQGESLPTAVRVYQLKSAAKLEGLELSALLRSPKELLGDDLLTAEEIFLEPRGSAEKVMTREKDARAVLVFGVFRRPAGTTWRDVVELPPPGKATKLDYALDEYHLVRR